MLERGVWWTSPERQMPGPFAANVDASYPPGDRTQPDYKKHPVQYWPRPDHRRGVLELLNATWANIPGGDRRDFGNAPQPLYRFNTFDELDVVTASGVGGGSLIYSNVSIRPLFEGGAAEVQLFPDAPAWRMSLPPDVSEVRDHLVTSPHLAGTQQVQISVQTAQFDPFGAGARLGISPRPDAHSVEK